jgi:hypothetical protein
MGPLLVHGNALTQLEGCAGFDKNYFQAGLQKLPICKASTFWSTALTACRVVSLSLPFFAGGPPLINLAAPVTQWCTLMLLFWSSLCTCMGRDVLRGLIWANVHWLPTVPTLCLALRVHVAAAYLMVLLWMGCSLLDCILVHLSVPLLVSTC